MTPPKPSPVFHLAALDTRYSIYVEPPSGLADDESSGPWPVLLCLDGDDQFSYRCAARKKLAASGSSDPLSPLLLVGIGYGASYQAPANRRGRDYTSIAIEGAPDGGGADAFLDLLITQLWPELARRYPVHPDIRGIAGHSLGALFALHALFKPAPFFNRVLASAPSIWWGDRVVLQQVAALRAAQVELPARLFLGVGLKDSDSMVTDLDSLEARLAENPFALLEIHRQRFPGNDHYNSIGPGFHSGLTALFS